MKTKPLCGIPWKVSKPKSQIASVPWNKNPETKPKTRNQRLQNKLTHLKKGFEAEELAKDFLLSQGIALITQNFRARCGELDLIMADGTTALVVEVRYRQSRSHGGALESIDAKKQRKIINCANLWWQNTGQFSFQNLRFDVVAIEGDQPIKWVRNAF